MMAHTVAVYRIQTVEHEAGANEIHKFIYNVEIIRV